MRTARLIALPLVVAVSAASVASLSAASKQDRPNAAGRSSSEKSGTRRNKPDASAAGTAATNGVLPAAAPPAAAAPAAATTGATKPGAQPADWPKVLPLPNSAGDAKASTPAAPAPATWTPEEISAGQARCAAILQRVTAVTIAQPPIRDGACGTPAPVELVSLGKNPQVAISPPAIVTCDLVEALHTWLTGDLQPLAKKHLGSEIIRIETMSSYSCRMAYGRAKNKLSEHGVANALDIGGFSLSSGRMASVLGDWGKPQREINQEIAAAKAAAEEEAATRVAAEKAAQAAQVAERGSKKKGEPGTPPSATASTAGAAGSGLAKSTIADGIPKLTITLPGATPPATGSGAFSIAPDKLGGPKPEPKSGLKAHSESGPKAYSKSDAQSAESRKARGRRDGAPNANAGPRLLPPDTPAQVDAKMAFLHEAHVAACRIFGTTLGPEANASHRNHFHVDMAFRRVTKICD